MYSHIRKFVGYFFHMSLKVKMKILNLMGVKIGKNTIIYTSLLNFDTFFPHLIEIGSDCVICKHTLLITHDYSRNFPTEGRTSMTKGRIVIGNSTFIGIRCIILPGVSIGNSVIVGAGSVVRESIPDNVVAAGNPARIISSLQKYMSKERAREESHDTTYVRSV